MNPLGALFIILGVLIIIMALKGSYSQVFTQLKKM